MPNSWFSEIKQAAAIEVFALTASFNEDKDPNKVNLGVGAYRTDDSKPYVLPVVRKVEKKIAEDDKAVHEYLPVAGIPDYVKGSIKLLLGADSPAISKADGIQAIGGTGAIRIGLDFLRTHLKCDTVYVSNPTWPNHIGIAKSVSFPNIKEYRYWDEKHLCIQFDNMIEDLKNAKNGSVILLHVCAQNPTGLDPTRDQWIKISQVMKENCLFPFFDCAYQGFSSGDVDEDAWPIRYFISQNFELFAAQSYSKNFGLYNERVGQLTFVASETSQLKIIKSQFELIVRQTWSNPPTQGAKIVSTILNDTNLRKEWMDTVKEMALRIQAMRKLLFENLKMKNTPGNWEHIVLQSGMFSFTGLNQKQVAYLISKYHIYLMSDGRINMCAITTKNASYVADAIHEAVTTIQ